MLSLNAIPFSRQAASRRVAKVALSLAILFIPWFVEEAVAQQDGSPERERPVIKNSIEMEFVLILAGQCNIGSPAKEENRAADEELMPYKIPEDFYFGRYEVMQFEYEELMRDNPSLHKKKPLPVHDVSWTEAESFCAKLSALDAEKKAGRSYRLPTEGEWEYACRAGTTTAYYFGESPEDLDKHAWTLENSGGKPKSPGGKSPNPWGLYDMYGNVAELCSSVRTSTRSVAIPEYFRVPGDSTIKGPDSKPVSRGGAYYGNKIFSKGAYRSAKRSPLSMDRRPEVGFRLVMVQAKPSKGK